MRKGVYNGHLDRMIRDRALKAANCISRYWRGRVDPACRLYHHISKQHLLLGTLSTRENASDSMGRFDTFSVNSTIQYTVWLSTESDY